MPGKNNPNIAEPIVEPQAHVLDNGFSDAGHSLHEVGDRSTLREAVGKSALAVGLVASSIVGVGSEGLALHEPSHPVITKAVGAPSKALTTTTKEVTETFTVGDSEVYAPNFTTSPQAGELTAVNAPTVNAESIANQVKGDVVESISVQGSASAEDAGPNSGVTTPSEQNVELAAKRAAVFEPQLEAALIQAGVTLPEIQTATPIEDSWSEQEVTQAAGLAEQFGYQDYSQMIIAYNNDPSQVPPAVETFLNQALQSHRDVRVVVVVDKQQQTHAISIPRRAVNQDKQHPDLPRHQDRTTLNHIAGYIPEDVYAAMDASGNVPNRASRRHPNGVKLPPNVTDPPIPNPPKGGYDEHSRVNAPQTSRNERSAVKHKQPLPGNYNPNTSRGSGNKNHSMSRSGRGRKA